MTGLDNRLEIAMANMLRVGVLLAALVVLAGGILYLAHAHASVPAYQHFRGAPSGLRHIGSIFAGAAILDDQSLIAVGILLLIATPVCRVVFGVVGFAFIRDRFYAVVSGIILAILLLSFFTHR